MAPILQGPHGYLAPPERPGRRRGADHVPDAFDRWLDRSLRDMFDERDGKRLRPEVRALLEPRPEKGKPVPPKRS